MKGIYNLVHRESICEIKRLMSKFTPYVIQSKDLYHNFPSYAYPIHEAVGYNEPKSSTLIRGSEPPTRGFRLPGLLVKVKLHV